MTAVAGLARDDSGELSHQPFSWENAQEKP
jgi:hypothetical protein